MTLQLEFHVPLVFHFVYVHVLLNLFFSCQDNSLIVWPDVNYLALYCTFFFFFPQENHNLAEKSSDRIQSLKFFVNNIWNWKDFFVLELITPNC